MRNHRFLLVVFLLTTGCVAHRPALLPPITTSDEFFDLIATRYDSLHNQEVRARIDLTINRVREHGAGAYALVRHRSPSDLKLIVGSLGTLLTARAQNDTLHVHLPYENRYLLGPPEAVLKELTGVDLSYYEYDCAIFGLPNLSPLDASRVVRFEPGRENIFLELQHGLYLRRLWIEARTGFLREERVYNADGQLVSARMLSDYRSEKGFALPRRIEIQQGEDVILIQVKSRAVNTDLTDEDFVLPVPRDATRYDIQR